MRTPLLSLFLSCLAFWAYPQLGQKEASQWRWGAYCGLNFQNGSPVFVNTSKIHTQYTNSCIADSMGNLLFYVKGADVVFNKNNDTMANGINFGGYGGGSQGSLIIRKGGSKYYLIGYNLINYIAPPPIPPMFNYAIVDLSLAAGLGSITVANQSISPVGLAMVGKLAATKHCNGVDHWLLTHVGGMPGSNQYRAHLVTTNNISTNPVISSIGSIQFHNYPPLPGFYRGVHKFSPNGRKVAATMPRKTVELYDFNTSTGVLSNVLKLDSASSPSMTYTVLDPQAIGLEFSPDGTKLYVSYWSKTNHPFLCQFDLDAGSLAAIIASKTPIAPALDTTIATSNSSLYSLQLAPDGKIYVINTDTTTLGVINSPNVSGFACNYVQGAVTMGTVAIGTNTFNAKVAMALPNFVSSYFEQKPSLPPISSSIVCGVVNFSAPALSAMAGYSVSSYYWNFNDPLSGANTSTLSNPTHTFSANGTYTVKLALNYHPCGTDTLKQVINITGLPVYSVTGKTTICKGESTVLNFSGANAYTLNTTALSQNTAQVQPTITTVYTVTAKDNTSGCSSLKTLTVTVLPCVGISETSLNESLKVYPNPNSGVFTFETPEACEVKIHNSLGQEVYRASVSAGTSLIDISSEAKGVYLLEWSGKITKGKAKLVLN